MYFHGFVATHAVGATTRPASTNIPAQIVIAADGSGDFQTLQEAIDAIPAYPSQSYTIHLLPGTYKQRVVIPRIKPHVRLIGDDAATTIITFDLGAPMTGPDGKPLGTFKTQSASMLADDFVAQNVTFENTFGPHGQALAAEVSGDRVVFDKCRFLGWQDTLFADSNGRNFFHDCYIEGHVDFIFGKSTAVFDHCEIRSKGHGYLTAASTEPQTTFGFVFLDCKLTADPAVKAKSVYLGRPWRAAADTAFIHCDMGSHIRDEGWFNWDKPEREKTARYAEFDNTGPGAAAAKRVAWATQMTAEQASAFTIASILAGTDHWNPSAELPERASAPSATQP